ncbi:unnamed protein product [Adineta steineri]|uniref:Uncharacterized protein n=1 Tax=Adineta steineri TaxID=433720 RepID=A0A819UQ00_9BILA|nr:unnamed protein product [Adineta steineri]CAF1249089.1 unnamed protein product [Adineta steineri]CAF3527141.1 unnamed protein product [Adineta steineri]CAF4098892.1 unnamed protein product [Adineta steineri]
MRLLAICILVIVIFAVFVDVINGDASKTETQKLSPASRRKTSTSLKEKTIGTKRKVSAEVKACKKQCINAQGSANTQEATQTLNACRKKCHSDNKKKSLKSRKSKVAAS